MKNKFFLFLLLFICLAAQAQTHVIDSLKQILLSNQNDTMKMGAYNELTYEYMSIDLDSAIDFSMISLKKYGNNKNLPRVSDIYAAIGAVYGYKRDFDNSLKYFSQSLDILKKTNLKLAIARSHYNVGLIYYYTAKYKLAADQYLAALKILEEIKDTKTLPNIYNGLGTIYKDMANYSEAMSYYNRAMKLYESSKDTVGIASTFNNIGNIYDFQNKSDEAYINYKRSMELKEMIHYTRGMPSTINNIGIVLMKLKRFDEAFDYFTKSLSYSGPNQDPISQAVAYDGIGAVYFEKKNYALAIKNYETSLKISKEVDSKMDIMSTYEKMAKCYSVQGNYAKAFQFEELLFKTKDSVLNAENTKQVTEMTTKYETEKKELQIQNLNKDKAIQQEEISQKELQVKHQFTQILFFAIALLLVSILAFFIFRSYRQKQKSNEIISNQKYEVELQRDLIEFKNREITDSIQYAQRIQRALLAGESILKNNLPEHFIFYKPKAIVSGDFYWAHASDNRFYLCTGDCTGHGVPGAFMSLLNISYLNEAVIEKKIESPDKIFDHVRAQTVSSLNPAGSSTESWDGMDAVLCMFDFKGGWLRFVCANNPLWLIRNNELKEFSADKMSVGKNHGNEIKPYTLNTLGLRKGDIIYTFSDGYADQFGGVKGKKFKYKNLQKVLLENLDKSMEEQKQILQETLNTWQGNMEQVDDILIIGVRV